MAYSKQGQRIWEGYLLDKVKFEDLSETGQKAFLEYGIESGRIDKEKINPMVIQKFSLDREPDPIKKQSFSSKVKDTVSSAATSIGNLFGGSKKATPSLDSNFDPKYESMFEPVEIITPSVNVPKLNSKVELPSTEKTTANNYLLESLGKLIPQTQVSERPERQQGPANRQGTVKPQIELPKLEYNSNPTYDVTPRLHEKIESGEVKPKLEIGGYTLYDSSIDKEAERKQLIEADKLRAEREKEARELRKKYKIEDLIDDGRADLIEKGWNINGAWMVANPSAAKSIAKIMKPLDTVFDSDFMARIGQKSADTILGRKTPDELKPTTDNKAFNLVADVAGGIGGLATPLPGMNASIYNLSSKVSNPMGNKVAQNMTTRIMPKLGEELTEGAISRVGISRAIDLMNIPSSKKLGYQLLYKGVPSTARTIASLGTIQAIEEVRSTNKTEEKVKNVASAIGQGALLGAIGSLVGVTAGEVGKYIKTNKIKGISLNAFDKEALVEDGYKKLRPGIWGLEKDGKISDVVVEGVLYKGEIVPVTSLSIKDLNNTLKQGTDTITRYHIGFNTTDGLSEVLTKSGYEKVPGRNDTFINPNTGEIRVLGTKEGADFIPFDHASTKADTIRESLNRQGINYSAANQDVKILEPVNKAGWRIAVRNKANEVYTNRLMEKGYKEAKNGIWQLKDNNGKVVDIIYEYAYTGKANPVPSFRLESLIPNNKGTKHIIDFMEKEIYKDSVSGNAKTQIEEVLPMERLMEVNPGVGSKLFENMVKLETLPRETVNRALKSKELINALNMLGEEVSPDFMDSMMPLALEKGAIVFNEVIKNVLPEIENVNKDDIRAIQDWNRELQNGKVSQTAIENAPTEFLVDFLDDIHYSEHRDLQDAVIYELNLRGYKEVMDSKNSINEATETINIGSQEALNTALNNDSMPNVPTQDIKVEYEPVGKPQEEIKLDAPRELSEGTIINFEGSEYKIKNVEGTNYIAVNTKTGETGYLPKGIEEDYENKGTRLNDIPMEDRALENVGDKKVKAYQWNNPEVKPFYQTRAKELLKDLSDTVKGERFPVKDDEGYIIEYMGQPRVTSEDIAKIKDMTGASYENIKDALDRIIKDDGQENTALAKRIELIIDDNLVNGYKTFTGMDIEPNEQYVKIRNGLEENNITSNLGNNTEVLESNQETSKEVNNIGSQQDNKLESLQGKKETLPNPVDADKEFTNQMTIAIPDEQSSIFDSLATVVNNVESKPSELTKQGPTVKMIHRTMSDNAKSILEKGFEIFSEDDERKMYFDNTIPGALYFSPETEDFWGLGSSVRMPQYESVLEVDIDTKDLIDINTKEEVQAIVKKYMPNKNVNDYLPEEVVEGLKKDGIKGIYTNNPFLFGGQQLAIFDKNSIKNIGTYKGNKKAYLGEGMTEKERNILSKLDFIRSYNAAKEKGYKTESWEDETYKDAVELVKATQNENEELVQYDNIIPDKSLSSYSIEVNEAATNKNTSVWHVTGNTKEHSEIFGSKGMKGMWYGPKKAWSFSKKLYPTREALEKAILEKLPEIENKAEVATTPSIETNNVTDTTINNSTNATEETSKIKEETMVDSANTNVVENQLEEGSEINESIPTNEIRTDGEEALGRVPSEDVQGTNEDRETNGNALPSTGEDQRGIVGVDRAGDGLSPSLGNGEGEVSTTATRERGKSELEKEVKTKKEKVTVDPKGQNVVIKKDFELGGPKERFKGNINAIRLLKELEAENRPATPKEQEALLKYVGWGGLSDAFYSNYRGEAKEGWAEEYKVIKELLTDEELSRARESTTNAFYTPVSVIKGMYKGLEKLGFNGGRMLEPALGTGHFIGAMPENMRSKLVNITGIELDSLTGRIAKKLYPNADIQVKGYEKANIPNNFYDIAVSNVPFDNIGVADKNYPNYVTKSLREYFFVKALDNVRPGGVVAFITSTSTLDNKTARPIRELMADKADFLGAIRLPNDTFKDNAGTTVLTDIIVLKKREEGKVYAGKEFRGIKDFSTESSFMVKDVNEYFVDNPNMILGKAELVRGRYNDYDMKVTSVEGTNIEKEIAKAFTEIAKVGKMEYKESIKPISAETTREIIPAPDHVKEGAYALKDGKLYTKENEKLIPYEAKNLREMERITGLMQIRDSVRELLRVQLDGENAKTIEKAREKLNKVYDDFVKKNDVISSRGNSMAFADDPDYYMLLSLEKNYDAANKTVEKADIFSKDTVSPVKPIDKVDTPQEALIVSLNELGTPDIDRMKELTGLDESVLLEGLEGRIFKNEYGNFETAEKYLSGNVRAKLKQAKAMAEVDSSYKSNIKYLEESQPKYKTKEQIRLQLGTPWVPSEVYKGFLSSVLNAPANSFKVNYIPALGQFVISTDHNRIKSSAENTSDWGTRYRNRSAIDIAEIIMNNKDLKVTWTDEDKKVHVDKKATIAVTEKAEKLKEQFLKWVWEDENRTKELENLFNETQNNINVVKYDGTVVYPEDYNFIGMNPNIKLRDHQRTAVWRVISSGGNTLLAHKVGAGKTFEMITSAMELRRLNIVKKPMFVVPNHLVDQWGGDFLLLYPGANILVPTKKDFQPSNRKVLMNRIATGDYDAIIVPESQFGMISMSEEAIERFFSEQIKQLESVIKLEVMEGKRGEKSGSEKAINESIKSLKTSMQKAIDKVKKDKDNITFETLGIDSLFVDEAHRFKNLMYGTKMNNVSGLGDKKGSGKAFDMYMKTRYLQQVNGGKGIVFATATPIMNSMAEMYTMQRYLQPDLMKQRGFDSFDAWANTFGKIVNVLEMSPEGGGFRQKQSFSKFTNVGELIQMFRSFADVLTDIPGLKIPNLKGGKPETVTAKPSAELTDFIQTLVDRAERVRNKEVDSSVDNMLVITNDGRKAALDIRLMDSSLPDHPDSKVNKAVKNIYDVWSNTKKQKSTQVVFMDLSTPDDKNFNLYDDMRNKLVAMGIPKEEVKFIHEATTDAKKLQLFDDMNSGKIRILFGSTEKMGVGMNAQKKMIALHHMDAPWRPGDIEQREGRILRQGNENSEVNIYTYATEESFDARMWDNIKRKAAFINEAMNGTVDMVEMEDIGEMALSYQEIAAIASGNPLIMEQATNAMEVQKYVNLKRSYEDEQYNLKLKLGSEKVYIVNKTKSIEKLEADKKIFKSITGDKFSITIAGKTYADRKKAGAELLKFFQTAIKKGSFYNKNKEPINIKVGEFAGFELYMGPNAEMQLRGTETYISKVSDSELGTIMSLQNSIPNFDEKIKQSIKGIENSKETIGKLESRIGLPFEHEEKLKTVITRQNEINEELNPSENEVSDDVEIEKADFETSIRQKQKDEKGPRVGIVSDPNIFNGPNNNFEFTDSDVGKRFKDSHGLKPESKKDKFKAIRDELWKQITRDFEHLPNEPRFEEARFALRKLKAQKDVANDKTLLYMQEVTNNIESAEQRFQFEVKVVLDNLMENLEGGIGLAFGYDDETLKADHTKISEIVAGNQFLKESVETRKAAWNDIKNNYIGAMADIGFDVGDKFQRENYFRQQVLEYSQLKKVTGTGSKLKTPTYRGYLKERKGGYDFNTNYLEAEYEVMSQMIYDTEIAKTLKRIKNQYDITPKLKDEAKKLTDEAMKPIKAKVSKDLEEGTITKDQSKEILRLAKKEYGTDWEALIPDGYTDWKPREGNIFYRTKPVTGELAEKIFEKMGADLKKVKDPKVKAAIEKLLEELNKQKSDLALGSERTKYIIPIELAETLDKLATIKDAGPLDKFFNDNIAKALNVWKAYQLMAPRRAFKYNVRNISGDGEAVALGNPRTFKKIPAAAKEVYSVFAKKEPLTGEMLEWFTRGGMQSILEVQELGDVNELEIFAKLHNQEKTLKAIPKNAIMLYWKNARMATESREAVLRYAAYLDYLEQMQNNPNGLPNNYGASDPERVKALSDIRDRAYKLSNELLGAYDSISVMGQDIRKYLIPFWSFQEVNFKRYIQLFKNASYVDFENVDEDGKLLGSGGKGKKKLKVGAAFGARMAAKFLIKATMLSSMLYAYNNLMFPDEEKELSMDVRRSNHIVLGRNSKGEVLYFTNLGVLDDFLSWFGLESMPYDAKDFLNGKKTIKEIADKTVKAPTNKLVNGLTPLIKIPAELITKKSTYPDVFNPSNIRDPWLYLAQGLSLGDEYKALTNKPGRPYRESISDIFVYKTEENKNAYYDMYDIKDRFKKENNKSTFSGEPSTDDKSMALYYLKQSLYHNDKESFQKYLYEYYANGGTTKGINQSLNNLHPLNGISKKDRGAFLKYLDDEENEILEKATQYYNDVILGNVKEFNKK